MIISRVCYTIFLASIIFLGRTKQISAQIPVTVNAYYYDGTGDGAAPDTGEDNGKADSLGIELIDGIIPGTSFEDHGWVGFSDDDSDNGTSHPQVTFKLADEFDLSEIQIVYFQYATNGYITAPEEVLVSFSTNGTNYTTPISYSNEFDHTGSRVVRTAQLDISGNTASYIRLDFRNTSRRTYLGEVTFTATTENLPLIAMDEIFDGTNLNTTNWIEHDSTGNLTQSNSLFMAEGVNSWNDNGLESVITFNRNSELIIESIAKISSNNKDATPIGYGTWETGIRCYYMTFNNDGNFHTYKDYYGEDTGVAYTSNKWYKLKMRLTVANVSYHIYSDINDDGDFDDAGEDTDLLATTQGNQLAHSFYNNLKVRFNNHSQNLLTIKHITVRERITHTSLQKSVSLAQALHDRAIEGNLDGEYPAGSKSNLQDNIDTAQIVDNNPNATKTELIDAQNSLAQAVDYFRKSVNGSIPVLHHILGTGQSLSIGKGGDLPLTVLQPYHNLMPSVTGQTGTNLIPLIEDRNLLYTRVETISSALGNTMTSLSPQTNYTSIVSRHGYGGYEYSKLKKGTYQFAKGMDQVRRAQSVALKLDKNYTVSAITVVHGETDHQNGNGEEYADYLLEWQADYNKSCKAITGQTNDIPMFLCQMSSHTIYGSATSLIPTKQLWTCENSPNHTLVCPKYFLTYKDGLHLNNYSYRLLGEYYGKALKTVLIDGKEWIPLSPIKITLDGANIIVDFSIPTPPLVIDTNTVLSQTDYGFELSDSSANITNVSILDDNTILIALDSIPGSSAHLRYAYTGIAGSWAGCDQPGSARGNIRDSDHTPSLYGNNLYNWLVHFDHAIPYNPARDDSDGDNLPDRWENLNFGSINISQGTNSNSDTDSMNDYAEWAAGTDPNNTESFFALYSETEQNNDTIQLSWDTIKTRNYTLLSTTNILSSTPWSNIFSIAGNDNTVVYTNNIESAVQRFYKVHLIVEE